MGAILSSNIFVNAVPTKMTRIKYIFTWHVKYPKICISSLCIIHVMLLLWYMCSIPITVHRDISMGYWKTDETSLC